MIKMKDKRGLAFMPLLIILGILAVVLFIIIKNPEICLSPQLCFRIVPLRWSKTLLFWIAFVSFFFIQAGVIYLYYLGISRSMSHVKRFISYLKRASIRIERYFIRLSY